MKVTENENKEIVKKIREGLEKTGGYCPCRIQRTPENKCMCEEFRRQIADPDFEGYSTACCTTRASKAALDYFPLT